VTVDAVLGGLRTFALWEINALLALVYVAWEHVAALVTIGAMTVLLRGVPATLASQRPWILAVGMVALLAALLAPAPAPFVMAALAVAATVAVHFDHYGPDVLRWRVVGGLALYALAALAYLAYSRYLDGLDAVAWAKALGGEGEAQQALAQGRAFVDTLARWGLWLIIPLGFLSMLAQGVFIHPPTPQRPEQLVSTIRTRGQR
jgi:hypothetical protein